MATFELQGPDGKTYEVEAPDMNAAVAAFSKMQGPQPPRAAWAAAKAGTLDLPAETSAKQAEIDAPVEKDLRAAMNPVSALQAAFLGLNQGTTFGFGDEIAARLASIGSQTYDQALARTRGQLEAGREQHPIAAYGGEIAGAVGTGIASAPKIAGGLGKRMLGGAGVGGVQGGVYGAGSAGNDRLRGAAIGAATGGGIGGLAPAAIAGAGKAVGAITGLLASLKSSPSPVRASRAIQAALSRSGQSADDIQAALAAALRDGQPEFVTADALGASGQRMLTGLARTPGRGRQEIVDFMTARQGDQGNRLGGFVSDGLDAPDTAKSRLASLISARSDDANAAYSSARAGAGPVDVRGALAAIDDRLGGMQGGGVVGDGIDAALTQFRNRLSATSKTMPDGATASELSDFNRVLGVKQDLDDVIAVAGRAGQGNKVRELMKLKAALDQALEGASDGYRAANDGFASASRVIDQVDAGSAATSSRARSQDVIPAFHKLTPEQQAAFKAGYADPTIAKIDASAPGVNKARPLLSPKSQAELGEMAGPILPRQIGREHTMFETANAALGGSKTADNLADASDVASIGMGPIANLLAGRFATAAQQAGSAALKRVKGQNDATQEMIIRALLSRDTQKALAPALTADKKNLAVSRLLEALGKAGGAQYVNQ